MFGNNAHEHPSDGIIVRVAIPSHHMESWRYPATSAKKLFLEHSLSAALSMVYGSVRIELSVPIRKSIQPMISAMPPQDSVLASHIVADQTVSAMPSHDTVLATPSITDQIVSRVQQPASSKWHSTSWMPSWKDSSLVALVCRAFYAEHCLGVALEYEDRPEELQPFYYPTHVQDNDVHGHAYGNGKLSRLVLGVDKSPTFSIELAHQLIPSGVMDDLSANTSTPHSSTLWPMWNRVTAQAIDDCSANIGEGAARGLREVYSNWLATVSGSNFWATSHPAGVSLISTNAWLRSISKRLDLMNITSEEYQLQLKLEKGAFRVNNNVTSKHRETRAELYAGPYGESMDTFKLLTSYDVTGRAAAHKVKRAKGVNISPVAQCYYDWLRGKGSAGQVADDRRRAENILFSANKDAQWIDVQLSRIAFKNHREQLPQRFKNML